MSNKLFVVSVVLLGISCASTAYYTAQFAEDVEDSKRVKPGLMINVGDINEDELAKVNHKIDKQVAAGAKQIYLRINSNGGSVFGGLEFIQRLEDLKKDGIKIKCVVDLRAISMGFVILQAACDERLATDRSLFLAHNGSISSASGTKEDLQEDVDVLDTLNHSMAKICAGRMGMPLEEYKKHLHDKKAWIFGAEEALSVHAIDGIVRPSDLPKVDNE
jgi:ATP-dependent protease ClpP protease subunit